MKSGNKLEAGKARAPTRKSSPTSRGIGSAKKSLRRYDSQTLKLLWGRAAGRCAMADCRIELFVAEGDYDPICVIGEMGHVSGSSDGGPRPSTRLNLRARDKYDNLILLCRNCHRKVDVLIHSYPSKTLLEIKAEHEAWVRTALPERGFSNLVWKEFQLQGDIPYDPTTIAKALAPDQVASLLKIRVSPASESWNSIQERMRTTILNLVTGSDIVASRVAVFPLAPVSACIYAGYLLTNRLNVRGFQYHRDQATWAWPDNLEPLTMPAVTETSSSTLTSAEVFFLFELSAPIHASVVMESTGDERAVYQCSVPDPSTGWLRTKAQLDELARKAREMFEFAAIKYPRSPRWHILYAGPAPGGVIVGQQLNPTMIPVVQLYEFRRPEHIPSITITPLDSSLTSWTVQDVRRSKQKTRRW